MSWLKENWSKCGVLVLLVLVIGLLYFSLTSQKENTNVSFDNKEKCAQQAQAYLQNERQADSPQNGVNANVLNEQYIFSTSLDTCLVYFEVSEVDAGTTYNIVDLLTNRKIYVHIEEMDQNSQKFWDENCKVSDGCFVNKVDFMAKFNELFR